MGDIVASTPERVLDANGNPVSGAEARFYLSGTSTPAIVYSDSAETVPHPTPILSNAAGVLPAVYRSGVALKVDVVDAIGGALPGYPIDPVRVTGVNSTQAAGISFAATDDIPANEVQTAIELVRASVLTPVANVGLGIDGLAPELAGFNATNTKAGHYRFTGTTVGTRPATWSAGNVGTVSIYRHDSVNAVMVAVKTTTNETAQRVLTAGVWGAWSTVLNSSLLQATPNNFAPGKVALAEYAHPNTIGTLINSATNLDTLLTPGKYYFLAASRPTNLPSGFGSGVGGVAIISKINAIGLLMQELIGPLPPLGASQESINVWRRGVGSGFAGAWAKDYNSLNDITESRSDLTAGRLLKVGDYGLGTAGEIITDLNAINWTGICRFGASTPNAPFTITGIVETVIFASNQCRQFAYSHSDAKRIHTRCNASGTWTPWVAILNQGNILEAVSQASGVPTGGLIERGSNGNGEYVRFADGTQICTTLINNDSVAWTTAEGSLFRSASATSWTFPAAFVAGSSPAVSGGVEIGTRPAGAHFVSLAATGVGWYGWTATSAAAGVNKRVMLSATGRWF